MVKVALSEPEVRRKEGWGRNWSISATFITLIHASRKVETLNMTYC